jgi:hypothetical protein
MVLSVYSGGGLASKDFLSEQNVLPRYLLLTSTTTIRITAAPEEERATERVCRGSHKDKENDEIACPTADNRRLPDPSAKGVLLFLAWRMASAIGHNSNCTGPTPRSRILPRMLFLFRLRGSSSLKLLYEDCALTLTSCSLLPN